MSTPKPATLLTELKVHLFLERKKVLLSKQQLWRKCTINKQAEIHSKYTTDITDNTAPEIWGLVGCFNFT